ncbi:MAG: hypothetical protein QNJ17_12225 [Desulfocapsaceae bacterium]|nr:hypothetical protein [Desulfocapsaceae bacterium]
MNLISLSRCCSNQQRVMLFVFISCMLFLVVGCAGVNRIIAPEQHIPLVIGERQQGTFNQGTESLSYEYIADDKTITVQGKVYPGRSISFLKVRLLFLDQQGSIIDGDYVYHSPYRSYKWRRNTFQDSVFIPNGTENISFDFYVEYRIRR